MPSKDEILAALPKLGHDDLEAIHAVISHIIGRTGAKAKPPPEYALTVFSALVTALGLPAYRYEALSPTARRQFEKKLPTLTDWLNANFKTWALNKTVQTAFIRMLFDLLIGDLKARNVRSSIGVVIANMDRLSTIFNDAFPGYVDCGMGDKIIQSLVPK